MPDTIRGGFLLLMIAMVVVFLVLAFLATVVQLFQKLFAQSSRPVESYAADDAGDVLDSAAVSESATPEPEASELEAPEPEAPAEPAEDAWVYSGRARSIDPRR